jgi:hypothetical protein
MNMITPAAPGTVGTRSIDVSRGEARGDLSKQWFSRPDDQRYTSLNALAEAVGKRRDTSFEELVSMSDLKIDARRDDPDMLRVITPEGRTLTPTHHSFGQMCSLVKAPASYLRDLPAPLAAINLQHGLVRRGTEMPMKMFGESEEFSLRAVTGPDYGRIYDAELVAAVQRIAGNGTGDTHWKIPGCIDWRAMTYNPYVDVTKQSTTLYASDRDVFMFLVDDTRPLEIGKLANGDPDLVFRGFYAFNSEVGTRALGIATFVLRGVCQNRTMWGVENFEKLSIVHSKHGSLRFEREAQPALERYARSEPTALLAGIKVCKETKAGADKDERKKLLVGLDFSMKMVDTIFETHEREEGREPESIWDMVNGITAVARTVPNTDRRLEIEKVATKLMSRATRNQI